MWKVENFALIRDSESFFMSPETRQAALRLFLNFSRSFELKSVSKVWVHRAMYNYRMAFESNFTSKASRCDAKQFFTSENFARPDVYLLFASGRRQTQIIWLRTSFLYKSRTRTSPKQNQSERSACRAVNFFFSLLAFKSPSQKK